MGVIRVTSNPVAPPACVAPFFPYGPAASNAKDLTMHEGKKELRMATLFGRWQMLKLAIPLIHASNAAEAEEFYCNRLGFRREFAHRADETRPDPCYMGLSRDGIWVHVSSFSGDGVAGGGVNFLVESVDALHAEVVKKCVA